MENNELQLKLDLIDLLAFLKILFILIKLNQYSP
jgi:hypothetical protein